MPAGPHGNAEPACPDPWRDAGPRPASEDEILALVDAAFPSRSPHVPFGRGHDCAELVALARDGTGCPAPVSHSLLQDSNPVFQDAGRSALSADLFLQDVHFRTGYFLPEEAGGKALSAAVGDLAAAGAVPLGFALGLMLPPGTSSSTLARIFSGMAGRARDYGIVLAGGDLCAAPLFGFSVTVWGAPAGPGAPFLRRGCAGADDVVFVIGPCGLARAGLWALERSGRKAAELLPACCRAHLEPRPLLREGRALALTAQKKGAQGRVSLMDVSDGPARDLPRLLGGLGADLAVGPELLHPELAEAAGQMGASPDALFLLGGEDYALLGTCPEALWPDVQAAAPGAARLGRVRREAGLLLRGRPFTARGFDHFTDAAARTPEESRL
ncbi:MAG: thiamine-phosphate kinase [Desulfovibrio sp.]|jgi:thiamine-monophosphate kinase|nr:thiamine-phosphate kinase [Desulfovibrio sp.]